MLVLPLLSPPFHWRRGVCVPKTSSVWTELPISYISPNLHHFSWFCYSNSRVNVKKTFLLTNTRNSQAAHCRYSTGRGRKWWTWTSWPRFYCCFILPYIDSKHILRIWKQTPPVLQTCVLIWPWLSQGHARKQFQSLLEILGPSCTSCSDQLSNLFVFPLVKYFASLCLFFLLCLTSFNDAADTWNARPSPRLPGCWKSFLGFDWWLQVVPLSSYWFLVCVRAHF